jgi:hypothetical protein
MHVRTFVATPLQVAPTLAIAACGSAKSQIK